LLLLFFGALLITTVGVQIFLGCFALDIGVVGEFALPALLTVTLLEENTEDSLRVNAEGNLLNLHGLEQLKVLFPGPLSGRLLSLTFLLFGGLLLLV
jgi:hypothetical protein